MIRLALLTLARLALMLAALAGVTFLLTSCAGMSYDPRYPRLVIWSTVASDKEAHDVRR